MVEVPPINRNKMGKLVKPSSPNFIKNIELIKDDKNQAKINLFSELRDFASPFQRNNNVKRNGNEDASKSLKKQIV